MTSQVTQPSISTVQDLGFICQSWVISFADLLPLKAVCLSIHGSGRQQQFQWCQSPQLGADLAELSLTRLGVAEAELQPWSLGSLQGVQLPGQGWVYGCVFRRYDCDLDVLRLWMPYLLTESQENWVRSQLQFLFFYLMLHHVHGESTLASSQLKQQVRHLNHQLRSPLALVGLYTDLLRDQLPMGPAWDYAQAIAQATEDLNQHLLDLAEYGYSHRSSPETWGLRALVIERIHLIAPWLAEKHLQVQYSDDEIQLGLNRFQLGQVLDNLLHNAMHFSPPQGTIHLHWQKFQSELLIEISDQGPGLSEHDLQHVFTPFYSQRAGGQGLGLVIVQHIVQEHRGRISVTNLPTGGALFSLSLPLQPQPWR